MFNWLSNSSSLNKQHLQHKVAVSSTCSVVSTIDEHDLARHVGTTTTRCQSSQSIRADDFQFSHLLCPFCRKLMTTDRQPILLTCGHSFCKVCVAKMPIFDGNKGSLEKVESRLMNISQTEDTPSRNKIVASLIRSIMFAASKSPEKENDEQENVENHQQMVINNGYGYIRCLECREKTFLSSHQILDDLEVNVFLATAADRAVKKMSICADCEISKSRVYCEECALYLCLGCSKRIHGGMITSQHNLIELDDSQEFPFLSVLTPICPHHARQEAILYCTTCEQLACILGAYGIHKQHDMSLLSDAIIELKQKLQKRTEKTKDVIEQVFQAKSAVDHEMKRLKEMSMSAQAFISKQIYEIVQVLQNVEKKMCQEVSEEEARKADLLKRQEMELDALGHDLKLRVQLATTVINNPNAAEMVEPTCRQVKTLDEALNDLPDLRIATSATIRVGMDELVSEMQKVIESVRQDTFPRDPTDIKILSRPKNKGKRRQEVDDDDDDDMSVIATNDEPKCQPTSLPKKATAIRKKRAKKEHSSKKQLKELEETLAVDIVEILDKEEDERALTTAVEQKLEMNDVDDIDDESQLPTLNQIFQKNNQ